MNTKILQKVLDNLNTEKPDLSYIRGMIETLLSMTAEDYDRASKLRDKYRMNEDEPDIPKEELIDEASILDSQAKAAIATVAKITEDSVEMA